MSARPIGAWLLGIATVAVLVTVLAAIAVIGSPLQQREERFDERRVQGLAKIESAVEAYASSRHRLPATLDALEDSPHGAGLRTVDPRTGKPYRYRMLDGRRYELCADFSLAQLDVDGAVFIGAEWSHPAGRACFRREVEERRTPGPTQP